MCLDLIQSLHILDAYTDRTQLQGVFIIHLLLHIRVRDFRRLLPPAARPIYHRLGHRQPLLSPHVEACVVARLQHDLMDAVNDIGDHTSIAFGAALQARRIQITRSESVTGSGERLRIKTACCSYFT